ncbi:MAG: hypothetical protein R3E93_05030 [Thiothrix sp.]
MFDASALVNPAVTNNVLDQQQTLPMPALQDVMKFDNLFGQGKSVADVAVTEDSSILQLQDIDDDGLTSFSASMMDKISTIDGSYGKLMSDFFNRPKFTDFLPDKGLGQANEMRTYPHVSPEAKDPAEAYQSLADKTRQFNTAAIQYTDNMTDWKVRSLAWFSGMKIVSHAVKQVSEGFKTLFRAAG